MSRVMGACQAARWRAGTWTAGVAVRGLLLWGALAGLTHAGGPAETPEPTATPDAQAPGGRGTKRSPSKAEPPAVAPPTAAPPTAAPPTAAPPTAAPQVPLGPSPCPAQPQDIERSLAQAEAAFGDLRTDVFREAHYRALEQLRCVQSVVPPRLAADIHRSVGMRAFLDLDPEMTLMALQAMVLIQPAYHFEPEVVPGSSHGLHQSLEEARKRAVGLPEPVSMPRDTVLRVDGARSEERFPDRPAVVQVLTTRGELLWTGYVLPGDPLPPRDLPLPPRSPPEQIGRGLLIGAGVTVGVGVGALVGTAVAHNRTVALAEELNELPWARGAERYPALENRYQLTNGLGVTAQVAFAGAAALGLSGLVLTVQW